MKKDPYRRIARFYDVLIEPLMRALRVIGMKLQPPVEGMRVLEVGCGTATFLDLYERAGCITVGIDNSLAMVDTARRKLNGRAPIHIGDAARLPYGKRMFDLIIMSMTLHEMPLSVRPAVLNEACRVLKESGRILTIDYHHGPQRSILGHVTKISTYLIEFAAGGEHFRNYRKFMAGGGLPALIAPRQLSVEKKRIVGWGNIALYLLRLKST